MGKRNSPRLIKALGLDVGDLIGLVKTKPSPDYYPIIARDSGGGEGRINPASFGNCLQRPEPEYVGADL
jgi:hypothetical protein